MTERRLKLVQYSAVPLSTPPDEVAHGGGGGDNGGMETRIKALEEGMAQARQDLAVIRSNYATSADVAGAKTDIANAKTSIIMWVVGAIIFAQVLPALPGVFRAFGLLP